MCSIFARTSNTTRLSDASAVLESERCSVGRGMFCNETDELNKANTIISRLTEHINIFDEHLSSSGLQSFFSAIFSSLHKEPAMLHKCNSNHPIVQPFLKS